MLNTQPTVDLLQFTPIEIADKAISKCWDSISKNPIERINRVANQNKHASTIEHLNYTFDIDGISRACLQEIARHRIASYSVKSTRYTLTELKSYDLGNLPYRKFLVMTGEERVDTKSKKALDELHEIVVDGMKNDKAKYCMPESYKTSLVMTINARSMQNFLELRTSRNALWEIRQLAWEMYMKLPSDHRFLFDHLVTQP